MFSNQFWGISDQEHIPTSSIVAGSNSWITHTSIVVMMLRKAAIVLLLSFVSIVIAKPPKTHCEPVTLCIDGINACGVGWGGYKSPFVVSNQSPG